MATELPDLKTVASKEEVLRALWEAWLHCFGVPPKKESIWILLAQTALETGWMASCHNWNLGNVKSREGDGFDYCFFACNEILKKAAAEAYVAKSPQTAKITTYRKDGTCIIWFYPKHPACRFRAFHTLLEGCIDHISLVHKRFARSWPAVLAGDPAQYAHALKLQGYYTADEASYKKTLVSVFGTVSRLKVDYSSLPTQLEPDEGSETPEVPVGLNSDQKNRIMNLVALTMQQSLDDLRLGHLGFDEDSDGEKNA